MLEKDIVERCLFQPHYSGEASERLWSEVRHEANDRTLYDFACALQDLEHKFLAALNPGVERRARVLVRHNRAKWAKARQRAKRR